MMMKSIPGLTRPATTDLAVLKPMRARAAGEADDLLFSRWLTDCPIWALIAFVSLFAFWPSLALAQSSYTMTNAFEALWRWIPFLVTSGFVMNVVISFVTMVVGTIAGVFLGIGQLSTIPVVNRVSWFITQLFRNAPWLVLLFIVMLLLPFRFEIGGIEIMIPDWMKAVFGLSLPIMANISEVVRGAVLSVPNGQWESAESLAFSRTQTLWQIILPQCFKRMIPPWMNWYAILTMATPLVSLLGVEEIVTLSRQAMESEDNHPELLVPFYGFALLIFFVYCYPIARMTIALERRFVVKL